MNATLGARRPAGDGWAWELKWDGIRAITYVDGGRIRIFTRNGNEVTHRYPELRTLGAELGARDAVLDGEIVTLDEHGRPSFERLQQRMHVENATAIRRLVQEVPAVYMLFDVLWLDGRSVMSESYEARRARLTELRLTGASWQTPPHEVGDGAATLRSQQAVRARRCRRQAPRQHLRARSPLTRVGEGEAHDRTGIRRRRLVARRARADGNRGFAADRLLRRRGRRARPALRGPRRERPARPRSRVPGPSARRARARRQPVRSRNTADEAPASSTRCSSSR